MTHKHTEPHPSPSQSPSLTSSAPSCESPPPYLQLGLRRAARGSCSSSGVCRTAHSCLNRAQTASPRSSHICCDERRQQYRKHDQAELDVSRPRKSAMCVQVLAYVAAEIQFSLQFVFSSIFICKLSPGTVGDNGAC